MLWLERKYVVLAGQHLERFTATSGNTFNFRCWYCGDSQKNKSKKRGYIFERKNHFLYFCHNCGVSVRFLTFIKQFRPELYNQYLFEKIQNETAAENIGSDNPRTKTSQSIVFDRCSRLFECDESDRARVFISDRAIPVQHAKRLYVVDNFFEWTNTIIPGKFPKFKHDERRIIIPLLAPDKTCFAYQGRAIGDIGVKTKYITIIADEKRPRLFGLDRVDFNRRYFCTEGPFDSMFLDNAVARCGGVIQQELASVPNENAVAIYDNEPRNKQIVGFMRRYVANNGSIVIWPSTFRYKDINEFIVGEIGKSFQTITDGCRAINQIVNDNVFCGLTAEAAISEWARC